MHKRVIALSVVLAIVLVSGNAAGAATPPAKVDSAKLFEALTACRGVADSGARLACYDGAAAALDTAKANKDIVVIDRETVNKTKRGLFGFTLPSLGLFGSDDKSPKAIEAEQLKSIDGVISSAHAMGDGKWSITLEDGAVWHTTEIVSGRDPRIGQKLKIERGTMGSFFLTLEGGRSYRVARVN